jgi:hypothetical protein
MVFLVGLVYMVEMFVGNVYARYVLAYTGTIFIVGMLLGQKSEREWNPQQDGSPGNVTPQVGKTIQGRKG